MSKYNDDNQDFLKVAKMNLQKSEALKKDMDSLLETMNDSIESTRGFREDLERKFGVSTKNIPVNCKFERHSAPAEELSWEQMVAEANRYVTDDVDVTDFLTPEEIAQIDSELDEIDAEFSRKTGLRKKDVKFLVLAIALQCVRQYVLDPWLKEHRPGAKSTDEKNRKGNAEAGWYYVPTDKILTNRVPYDCVKKGTNASIQDFLKGGDHRLMMLGHDPILGWIFGTANIMTSTITRADFKSAHVKCINNRNTIYSLADTGKIFIACKDRIMGEGIDGKIALGSAVLREGIHLKSDVGTKRSLPLPGIGVLSTEAGKKLAKYGIDTASVGTEFALASMINCLIAMVHKLCMDDSDGDEKFYEVRTRKIIMYSNLIASTSNIIVSMTTKNYKLLDVGGLLVTISRLFSDIHFIAKVKQEFIDNKLDVRFQGIKEEVDSIYSKRFN